MAADDIGSAGRGPTNFGFVALRTGTRLDNRYTIEHVIAAGGFGVTYYAHHEGLDRACAIKEHFPRQFAVRDETTSKVHASDPEIFSWALERFLQEGRALAQCKHPNVVDVADVFEANGTAYMVLDYEQGTTMRRWLDALGRRPTQTEIDGILAPLLDALAFVHAQGLLHRDLAPDNIMIRADGQPCLIDFGAARQAIAQRSHVLSAIVKSGYSPPEQYTTSGKSQGPWSDIYALGATIYHAISGRAPVESTERQLEDELKPAAEAVAAPGNYRPAFLAAIDAALRLKHSERPRNIAEWRAMLLPSAAGASDADTDAGSWQDRPAPTRRLAPDEEATVRSSAPPAIATRDGTGGARLPGTQPNRTGQYLIGSGMAVAMASVALWYFAFREPKPVAKTETSATQVIGKSARVKTDARAQFNLGLLHETGRGGLARNEQEAARLYRLAADQDNPQAQNNLGVFNAAGRGGLSKNDLEAARLYRLAADQGNTSAQANLGVFHEFGRGGLAKNRREAIRLYRLAADQGNAFAQAALDRLKIKR